MSYTLLVQSESLRGAGKCRRSAETSLLYAEALLRGHESAEIVLAIGAGGINFTESDRIEFILTHSDDDSTYEAVTADDLLGVAAAGEGGIVKALVAAHAAAAVYRFGCVGRKRYLKPLAGFSGTHATGTPIAALVIKGHGQIHPQAGQA